MEEKQDKIIMLPYKNENIYRYYVIDTEKDELITTVDISPDFLVASIETIKRLHLNNGNIIDIPIESIE